MPLTKIQTDVLRLLAAHRDPESYVAGSTPINRTAAGFSSDMEVFHDREERVARAASEDAAFLESHGFTVRWQRREPAIYTAAVEHSGEATKLEWVVESDYRFFPTVPDEIFGYVLHPVDLAVNKVMAAAGRREVRDLVDLVTIHETIIPLGAAIWAAVDKAPGFTPAGLIREIRRNSSYSRVQWRALMSTEPVEPDEVMTRLRLALDEAGAFVGKMPTSEAGLLFLENGRVVQPDPARLGDYQAHSGQRRGQWPASSEIDAALFEHYQAKPRI